MTNLETNFLEVLTREAVWLFPAPLAQIRTALIQDFYQWFCKKKKGSQGRAGHMIKTFIMIEYAMYMRYVSFESHI